jgi:hypothetical protein
MEQRIINQTRFKKNIQNIRNTLRRIYIQVKQFGRESNPALSFIGNGRPLQKLVARTKREKCVSLFKLNRVRSHMCSNDGKCVGSKK